MILTLIEIRHKLIRLWSIFFIAFTFLFIGFTLNEIFEDIHLQAWTWFFSIIGTPLLFIFISEFLNINAGVIIRKDKFILLYNYNLFYLTLVSLSLIYIRTGRQIDVFFLISYAWFIPLLVITLVIYYLLFYKKSSFFQPNEKIFKELIFDNEKKAKSQNNTLQVIAIELIRNNDYNELFEFLTKNSNENSSIILLQSQFNHWSKNKDLNLAPSNELQVELNRITYALLKLIQTL